MFGGARGACDCLLCVVLIAFGLMDGVVSGMPDLASDWRFVGFVCWLF